MDHLLKRHGLPLWEDMEVQPIEELEKHLDPEDTGLSTFIYTIPTQKNYRGFVNLKEKWRGK